jgi:Leucine-rich repeat (LRR) protein
MNRRQLPVIWPRLETLNLSYNRIPITSISYLSHLGVGGTGGRLKELNLAANNLTHLPDDLSFLRSLEVLILSHNQLSSSTSIFNPNKHFIAFASIPRLKKLDLAYN